MVFAKRPDNGLERPYRSSLIDLTVLPDAKLRTRRAVSIAALPGFVAMFIAGCVGLALDPQTIGQLSLVAGAAILGIIMSAALIGGLFRIRKEFATRAWARTITEKDQPDRRPWDD